MANLNIDEIKSMHGDGGYWCQGDAVYVQANHEIMAISLYRLKLAKGGIGVTSSLNTLDAFKSKSATEAKNLAYVERNKILAAFCKIAVASGLTAGIGQDEGEDWEDDWRNIIFLELPTGQISFHVHDSEKQLFDFLPLYQGKWDGHDTETKWQRLLGNC